MQQQAITLLLLIIASDGKQYVFNNVTFFAQNSIVISSNVLNDDALKGHYHHLECSQQNITTFPSDSIGNLTQLKRLVFSATNTSEIQSNAFRNLPKLKILTIIKSPLLKQLPNNAFDCSALLVLNLSGNALEHLQQHFLRGVPKLRQLDLSGNRLQTIQPTFFSHTPHIYDLHLSRNRLTEIPEGAFKYLEGPRNFASAFDGFNVTILLDYNEIENFSALAFGNGVTIDYLLLAGNELESFDGVLDQVVSVEWLELSQNNIDCLNYENMEKVKVLMVDENPWDCVCLKNFKENRKAAFFANAELSRCLWDE